MKITFLALLFTCASALALHAQTDPYDHGDKVFTVVEETPRFPEGDSKLYEFISANLVIPEQAIIQGTQGKVFVSFIVEKDGSISEPRIVKSLSPEVDAAALEVVKKLPAFSPAKQNGRVARYMYTIPVAVKRPVLVLPLAGYPEGEKAPEAAKPKAAATPAETEPVYKAGLPAMQKLIAKNLKNPPGINPQNPGQVYVYFMVNKDGSTSQYRVENYRFGLPVTEEALRVARLLQGWEPARYKGQPIDYQVQLPIWFPYSK